MKKEVIPVPKEKCPLDVLAEMGERTKNSWIFFHYNLVESLCRTAEVDTDHPSYIMCEWKATKDFPRTLLYIEEFLGTAKVWIKVLRIDAVDIAFSIPSADPEDIYFLKMDE